MSGSWLFLPDQSEWRLYDLGRVQIRVRAERVDELARAHDCSRRDVLAWIGSRPRAPFGER